MLNTENFLKQVDKEILRIAKKNITKRLLHNGERSIDDVILAMREEGYNETEIAEALFLLYVYNFLNGVQSF